MLCCYVITLKRLMVWSTMSSWLEEGAGPLAEPLLVCLRGIRAMLPYDFPLDSRLEWKGGMAAAGSNYTKNNYNNSNYTNNNCTTLHC